MRNPGSFDRAMIRLLRLAVRLGEGKPVTSLYIRDTFAVSIATAKRDLVRLEWALPVTVEERGGRGPFPQKVLRLEPSRARFLPLLRVAA